jgi:hypothetical protein
VTFDDRLRTVIDRILQGTRGSLETELRELVDELRRNAEIERTRAVAQAAETAVSDVRQKAHAQLAQIREAAQKHTEEVRRMADRRIQELERALDAARSRAQAEVEDARRLAQTQVDDVQRVMDERIADLQQRVAEAERRLGDARQDAAARARTREREQEHVVRLLDALRHLDEARSLGEVLERLAQGAAREAERVAVLVARDGRLRGWSAIGFGAALTDARSIDIEVAAVSAPPFAEGAGRRDAVAVPVVVGGTAVAVLYADAVAGETATADRWRALVEALARHAGRALEALTLQRALGLSSAAPVARASHQVVAGPPGGP